MSELDRTGGGSLFEEGQRLFSRRQAAGYLSKSLSEIDKMIRSGTVIAKKDGRRTIIERRELDRFADRLPIIEPS